MINQLVEKHSDREKVYVYTDGSYRDGIYSGAFLVFRGLTCIYQDSGCGMKAASMHNIAGELSAVMHAARWLKRNNYKATIIYDYTGIKHWAMREWKAKNEFTRAYQKFIYPYLEQMYITFRWVKGHDGDIGNTMADNLARKALESRKEWNS